MALERFLLPVLQAEQASKISGGIYHKLQIEFTFNSNHIEGSRLTEEQTRYIYETKTIFPSDSAVYVNDVIETVNHFRCIDKVVHCANAELNEDFIKDLHLLLKTGTVDSIENWFVVGDYKKHPNEIGGVITSDPSDVQQHMEELLTQYHQIKTKSVKDLIEFHYNFEKIHPFQDGNGRVGRLVLLKECLNHEIIPFIIDESLKSFYYRGLSRWKEEKGYLTDTCLTSQDRFKKYLDYFRISYHSLR